eukprot:m.165744 g.165744  ORF g.165744 m.165744 type:complete len:77 (-) comp16603_c0_seq2:9-239(-)
MPWLSAISEVDIGCMPVAANEACFGEPSALSSFAVMELPIWLAVLASNADGKLLSATAYDLGSSDDIFNDFERRET